MQKRLRNSSLMHNYYIIKMNSKHKNNKKASINVSCYAETKYNMFSIQI